ncbi:hypothetical protein GCM10022212_27110 [Actimicrobium antarcticum]|uniref:Uncharacterized protein n=1 Tax=Actimicrobium antarcticum TaxID=1051899 RepID=A0ABP7TKJ6_9BURK
MRERTPAEHAYNAQLVQQVEAAELALAIKLSLGDTGGVDTGSVQKIAVLEPDTAATRLPHFAAPGIDTFRDQHLGAGQLQRFASGLSATHTLKEISGNQNQCAWQCAWMSVMLQLTPEQLKRSIIESLGESATALADHMHMAATALKEKGLQAVVSQPFSAASRLHFPGKLPDETSGMLSNLTFMLLEKSGASFERAHALAFKNRLVSGEDMLRVIQQLGAAGAVLEIPRGADGAVPVEGAIQLHMCTAREAAGFTAAEDTDNAAGLHTYFKQIPVAIISDNHFNLHIPTQFMPPALA